MTELVPAPDYAAKVGPKVCLEPTLSSRVETVKTSEGICCVLSAHSHSQVRGMQ